jgi:hypothetical protein
VGAFQPAEAQAAVTVTIAPATPGNTAVHSGQQVTVTGSAPAGQITSADLIAVDAQGDRSVDAVPNNVVNRTPAPVGDTGDYLYITAGGQVAGRLTLGCLFASATQPCPHDPTRKALLEITVGGASDESNLLRVDYTRPWLRPERQLVAPDRVLVRFSEPVRQPQQEIGGDWLVKRNATDPDTAGIAVTSVDTAPSGYPDCVYQAGEDNTAGATGCTRLLHLAEPLGEDATPTVIYWLGFGYNVPDRTEHVDFAENQVFFRTEEPREALATDLIRPARPNIQSIDGKTLDEGTVLSSNTSPVVRLTNLTAGHNVRLVVDGHRQPLRSVPAGANAVDIQLTGLTHGKHNLSALAIDPHGNRSTDQDKRAPRADGIAQATYNLDTLPPRLLAAALVDRRTVLASFSEAILPTGDAGKWTVTQSGTSYNVTAEGTGAIRRLVSSVDLPDNGVVKWVPTSTTAAPGSVDRYGDRAGNALARIRGITLNDLPALAAPRVTRPGGTRYSRATSQSISGTAPDKAHLVAELFETGAETVLAKATVANGRWAFTRELEDDGRYSFQVRLRNTDTGVASPRVAVPDIVLDTKVPVVDVTAPALAPTLDNPSGRKRVQVGDAVTIKWTATDAADGDTQRPDHGDTASIVRVDEDGTRVVVAKGIDHQPGKPQSYAYRLKSADLAGAGERELTFDVIVTDLARNRGDDSSAAIVLLADLIGYTAVLTKAATPGSPGIIEARFPVALQGSTLGPEWLVNGTPSVSAQKVAANGRTIVRLSLPLADDPNATSTVEYNPPAPDLNNAALRDADGTWVSSEERETIDGVAPALTVTRPATPRVIDARRVRFTGTTDETSFANTIAAFRATRNGTRTGTAIARGTAGTDGTWALRVPIARNRRNRIVIQAVDPSGNRSATRPSDPYTVVEDSVDPVVSLVRPRPAGTVGRHTTLRWRTIERHRKSVQLSYRRSGGQWRTITRTADDGSYRWSVPRGLAGRIFKLRVRAIDVVGRYGTHMVRGIRADFQRPRLTGARSIGAKRVRLFFSEPIRMSPAGFTVDGIRATRVTARRGSRATLVLKRQLTRTTPWLEYSGRKVTDRVGNRMRHREMRVARGFVFAVQRFSATRLSSGAVRLRWRDARNRPGHLQGYRIYRDGRAIGLADWDARSALVTARTGSHRFAVRAVDNERRVSPARTARVR